jgi:hypothetical protein
VSPLELAESPELASLELLCHALSVTRVALLAVHPELQQGDFVAALLESRSLKVCSADALITHLDALDTALERYRELVERTPSSIFTSGY